MDLRHSALGMCSTEHHCSDSTLPKQVLRDIVNAPWYIRNTDLHRDLNMEMVTTAIRPFARKHEARLHQHVNVEAIQVLDNSALVRRLKRTKPLELV